MKLNRCLKLVEFLGLKIFMKMKKVKVKKDYLRSNLSVSSSVSSFQPLFIIKNIKIFKIWCYSEIQYLLHKSTGLSSGLETSAFLHSAIFIDDRLLCLLFCLHLLFSFLLFLRRSGSGRMPLFLNSICFPFFLPLFSLFFSTSAALIRSPVSSRHHLF